MKTTNKKAEYPAESIGVLALQRIRNSRRWCVLCVYRHCFYCQDHRGDIICIGTDKIGHGPFTIRGKSLSALLEIGISAGDVLYSENNGCLGFENSCCVIDLGMAQLWDATFYPSQKIRPDLERHIELLRELALRYAPKESLGRLIPAILSDSLCNYDTTDVESQLSQLLINKTASVMKTVQQAETCNHQDEMAGHLAGYLHALIGTGFGLTPSGDDFCSGVVLGTALLGDSRKARDLAILMKRGAAGKTTRISYAYYSSLAESYISESQARLLDSFGKSDGVDMEEILLGCANHGSTSGWDMLAGFAFSVELMQNRDEADRIDSDEVF